MTKEAFKKIETGLLEALSISEKMSGYPVAMTKKGLLELKDPANRDHPTQRWGQAVVTKFFGVSRMPSGSHYPTNFLDTLYNANDEMTEKTLHQLIIDYQL